MKYDYISLYNANKAFLDKHPLLKRATVLLNPFLTAFVSICYAFFCLYALRQEILDPKAKVALLFVPALAFLTVTILRLAIERPRPYNENGANIQPIVKKCRADTKSFPSRHMACAAVIAVTFLRFLPWVGVLLLALSLVLAYTRFALGLHYPSDLLVGEGVGLMIGCLIFII
ncbi:MAG: phosphatase PAP2 family protein [Clostridia bacterium]|nr:phosphatase PAP2 family protein [Clostridia bacterium]